MPSNLDVAFVAVDEVQLCGDLERGHIFTDRMFSPTRAEDAHASSRDREPARGAAVAGSRRDPAAAAVELTSLARRRSRACRAVSAIGARFLRSMRFYAIAELIRRAARSRCRRTPALWRHAPERPGRSLSVRDVDYIVATVRSAWGSISTSTTSPSASIASSTATSFAACRRRIWRRSRAVPGAPASATALSARTGRCPAFEMELCERLESHTFEAVTVLQWRKPRSIPFDRGPTREPRIRAQRRRADARAVADDVRVLERAARETRCANSPRPPSPCSSCGRPASVPDYRKIAPAAHAE